MDFKDRIKTLRKEKEITQEQLAEYMGVSPQAISRWETGATCPDIFSLPALAELFSITVDELLGVNKKEKQKEIRNIISIAEENINNGMSQKAIINLREALNKYPNSEHLLCSLMYALYVASDDKVLSKVYDSEIISIYNRIQQHSTDTDIRNEALRILFRHYCDTNRKHDALLIADGMSSIEASLERNIYWALEGEDRIAYLNERIADDLRYLLWDISAYSYNANISNEEKHQLDLMCNNIKDSISKKFDIQQKQNVLAKNNTSFHNMV